MQFIIRQGCGTQNIDLRDLAQSELADLAQIIMDISSSLSQQGVKLVVKSNRRPSAPPKQRQLSEQN